MTKVKPIDFSLFNEIRPCHASVVGYLLIWSTSLTCLLRGQAWLWCCNGKAPGADSTHSCEPGMGVAEGRGCHLLMLRLDFAHSCESGMRAGQGFHHLVTLPAPCVTFMFTMSREGSLESPAPSRFCSEVTLSAADSVSLANSSHTGATFRAWQVPGREVLCQSVAMTLTVPQHHSSLD